MLRRRTAAIILVWCLLFLVLFSASGRSLARPNWTLPSQTSTEIPAVEQIAFETDRDTNSEIYIMNADGSGLRNLTTHSMDDRSPAWSPDGSQLTFESDRDGKWEIYVMNADGSHLRRLTNDGGVYAADSPAWSPDGSQIAFRAVHYSTGGIYVMNADGSNPRLLDNTSTDDYSPAWSPDGSQIAFKSNRDGNPEIYVMNADGSSPRNLTQNSASDFSPAWSPDGSQIAFASDRDGGSVEIYVMNADGSNPRLLTDTGIDGYSPAWSPDGSQIAFVSERGDNPEIYVMNANGSSLRNLTQNEWADFSPAWRPAPKATAPTPTAAVPTPIPAGSSNQGWTSVIQDFNAVEMVLVPAGCFMMGSTHAQIDYAESLEPPHDWYSNDREEEQPIHQVCFEKPFWIDRTEVTNAQFRTYGGQAANPGYWTDDNRPREQITWIEAQAFCEKRGARLPTEAEWEYAARGPKSWIFPWGDEFMADNVVYNGNSNQTAAVGSKPNGASWVGALDLSGNVWEWVADWYGRRYSPLQQTNPTGPDSGIARVLRGGSFYDVASYVRAAVRYVGSPDSWGYDIGFRCARSAEN